jgi:putative ABC transport system ATP-binding protein
MYCVIAKKLSKTYKLPYQSIEALKGIDFSIKEGEFIAIMGPSGAGKTTLLNLIGCLDTLTDGYLEVLGKNLSKIKEKELINVRKGRISFVFEEFLLISSLNAKDNVGLPLYFLNKKRNVYELLEKVGLKHRMEHFPSELSGGELQRVAIARAMAISPRLLLADEPTGNLDTNNAENIFYLFRKLNEENNITIIVATHNVKLAYKTKRIIHLRDGKIIKDEKLSN